MTTTVLTEWFRHVPEDKWLRDPAACRHDAQRIWEHLALKPDVTVFECPCGKADIGFPLARLGALVEGIDFNSHFISAAQNKFFRAGLRGHFRVADMLTTEFTQQVDVIINWASSFGYFSDEKNTLLLQRFSQALKSDGCLLIEVANPVQVIAGNATRLLASGEVAAETWDAVRHRAEVVFPATPFRGPVAASVRVYTAKEFETLLTQAGFTQVQFFGEDFTEYTPASRRLIVQARKA